MSTSSSPSSSPSSSTAPGSTPVDVFELGSEHEQVVFCTDEATGLRAIVAIHSTALGPALGGTRFYPYASTDDAVRDVLDLSRGMTYKAAVAGLDLGGGKAVILGDPAPSAPTWTTWRGSATSSPAARSPTAAPGTARC